MEKFEQAEPKLEKQKAFEEAWDLALKNPEKNVSLLDGYSKSEFLDYVAQSKKMVLHGSNYRVDTLIPKQANCRSKKFGNLEAVYATKDSVLPIFYAIKDKNLFRGVAESGVNETENNKEYHFAVEEKILKTSPWSGGQVYILPEEDFEQGTDDSGQPIDEYVSRKEIKPVVRIDIGPEDFPYLDKIVPLPSHT